MARVCIPLAEEFEDSEYAILRDRLEAYGHQVVVIGSERGTAVCGNGRREVVFLDRAANEVSADDFDAVVIAGGHSPDKLRSDANVVALMRNAGTAQCIIAAVCHGPQLLIEAGLTDGRTMTSWPSLRTDLEDAGARWVDVGVCVDGNLITSRSPGDLEAFSRTLLDKLEATSARPV